MVKGLYTAHTGMVNEMKRLDILANNLANADTTAYKKEGTTSRTFADEMSLRIKDSSNMGIPKKLGDITYGVHLGQVYTDYSTGNFKMTVTPQILRLKERLFCRGIHGPSREILP